MSSLFRRCALAFALVVSAFPVGYACPWEGTVSNIPQSSAMTKEASDEAVRYIESNHNHCGDKMIVDIGSKNTFAALYGRNGCWGYGDDTLNDALKTVNSERKEIRDVCVTADGSYVIITGEGGYRSRGAPNELTIYMDQACESGNRIYSAAFNAKGGYILITERFVLLKLNSQVAMRRINPVDDKFGKMKSCYMTDAGYVVCCERGVVAFNIPQSLAEELNERRTWIPDYIKFEDSGQYFICWRTVKGRWFSWWLW